MSKAPLQVIVGAQYGSEAKGAVAAYLARGLDAPLCIRVGGPNAGHTVYDDSGVEWKLQQVPVGLVTNPYATGYIAAGSEVDVSLLNREIEALDIAGLNVSGRLQVSGEATIIQLKHSELETGGRTHGESGLTKSIGSTGKGVGAARAERLMRTAQRVRDTFDVHCPTVNGDWPVEAAVRAGRPIQIEGTQGYALGLHAGAYPFTTSGDCRAIDFLAQAGVNPWGHSVQVWLVARCYPIRVAGNSGPMKDETTWEELGLEREHTTVTKKVRRVGGWDPELLDRAIVANIGGKGKRGVGALRLAVTMLDQKFPKIAGQTPVQAWGTEWTEVRKWIRELEDTYDVPVGLVGTGPRSHHLYKS